MISTILKYDKRPRLSLVGAGPGDPELITLKAVKTLQSADIVLYDALVSEEILALIPPATPSLSVGKRAGDHSFSQHDINELIVEFAYLYGHVVRLKGGDPFVFGRATEEIGFAAQHGIETTVIPGVSSALAVPAAMNIPVTARGISESFWVVTGTTMAGAVSSDVELAAQSTATVVILMGLKKIDRIMAVFETHGKADTPVAVIQDGTLSSQRCVIGSVSTIVNLVESEKITSPAIIIVGEVVKYTNVLEKIAVKHIRRA
jgi:uroporphyrin-III C-methyltransferase